jgi:hypothetical protein
MTMEDTNISRSLEATPRRSLPRGLVKTVVLASAVLVLSQAAPQARVLDEHDLERISNIKTSFADVMTDVVQTTKRPDLSAADAECLNSALHELMQISEELKSYEYLLTIESQLNNFDDDKAMKDILRFAVEKSLDILEVARRRLGQLSEQCSRYPLSAAKMQQEIRFIEGTTAILKSLKPRL